MSSGGEVDTAVSPPDREPSPQSTSSAGEPVRITVRAPGSESHGVGSDEPRDRVLQLLDPIIYGSIFDYPLTLAEIHAFCTLPLTLSQLETEIRTSKEFDRLVGVDHDYYFLKGQETLPDIRRRREAQSIEAWRTARRIVNLIKYVPFIEGILASGSLAVNNVKRDDDLDFLMLVRAGRLWLVFLVLGTLQRLFSRRYLCPNYYISTAHLRLPRQTFYVAREAIQARPLYGAECCRRFYAANDWLLDVFPNAGDAGGPTLDAHSGTEERPRTDGQLVGNRTGLPGLSTRLIEWMLGGWLGDLVERALQKVLRHRLVVHYRSHGQDVPADVWRNAIDETELRFHGLNHEQLIYRAIETRRAELLARLDTGAQGAEPRGPAPDANEDGSR